jgi:hypothetical protein
MSPAEKREAARLASERWRRAHGIGPRKPAQRPWLAEGISRSTWYRRGNRISGKFLDLKFGKFSNLPGAKNRNLRTLLDLTRAESFTRQLQAELAGAWRLHKIVQGIIGELRI